MNKTHKLIRALLEAEANLDQVSAIQIAKQIERNRRARETRRMRDAAYRSVGMVKVRGNLGGTYYE